MVVLLVEAIIIHLTYVLHKYYSFYTIPIITKYVITNSNFQKSHGGPDSEERHVGDLGNIDTEDGHAIISIVDLQAKLSGEQSIMNRSIVIHEGK